ncbi:hypothetical protein DH2020_023847 [Rehmannia glutinosa]|uniref:DC1 domain-containing protein n=1 Tax=Rehmannia glutinosa TaxID=99300 RepID=A0ABR0W8Y2_REHGL
MKYSEITHFSHPHHKLKFHYTEAPFKCDGCKEIGIGSSYKCGGAACDFDLHTHCAIPSASIAHPFYTKCSFQFLSRPPGGGGALLQRVPEGGDGIRLPLQVVWGRSWSYRSSCKKYNLHVACVKEMLVDSWHELYNGGAGGNNYTGSRKSEGRIPNLKATLETHINHTKSKGKAQKCCEVAGLALQFVVSAVLGDPTTLIASLVGTLMSK